MVAWSKPRADKVFDKFSIRQIASAIVGGPITHRKHESTESVIKRAQEVFQNNGTKVTQRIHRLDRKLILRTRQRCGIVVIRREDVFVIEHELRVFGRDVKGVVGSRVAAVFYLFAGLGKHRRARLGREHVKLSKTRRAHTTSQQIERVSKVRLELFVITGDE